jgi:hypothetical protein
LSDRNIWLWYSMLRRVLQSKGHAHISHMSVVYIIIKSKSQECS